MKKPIAVASLVLLGLAGCTSHLVFFEESHLGLKAAFEANNPAPAQLSVGYRRGVVTVIPQKSEARGESKPSGSNTPPVTVTQSTNAAGEKVLLVTSDPNELMSIYTTFKANIGFADPVEIKHFLATGTAATSLLADHEQLRQLTEALKQAAQEKGTTP